MKKHEGTFVAVGDRLPAAAHALLPPHQIRIVEGRNDRQQFDTERLLGLQLSLEGLGQLQEIIVNRHLAEDGSVTYELVAGERRLRAALEAAPEDLIACSVYSDLTAEQIVRIVRAENRERVELNPLERALSMEKLANLGWSDKRIAADEGCSVDTVRRMRSLLKLPNDVLVLVTRTDHPLPVHQAALLTKLPQSDQIQIARKAAPIGGPVASEAQVRDWVNRAIGKPLPGMDEPEPAAGGQARGTGHEARGEGKRADRETAGPARAPGASNGETAPPDREAPAAICPLPRKLPGTNVFIEIDGYLTGRQGHTAELRMSTVQVTVNGHQKLDSDCPAAITSCPGLATAVEMILQQLAESEAKPVAAKKPAKRSKKLPAVSKGRKRG